MIVWPRSFFRNDYGDTHTRKHIFSLQKQDGIPLTLQRRALAPVTAARALLRRELFCIYYITLRQRRDFTEKKSIVFYFQSCLLLLSLFASIFPIPIKARRCQLRQEFASGSRIRRQRIRRPASHAMPALAKGNGDMCRWVTELAQGLGDERMWQPHSRADV